NKKRDEGVGMKAVVIIPARLASSRLKRKPLALIEGKSLIRRVYENALNIGGADKVAVAAESEEVKDELESFGGEVVMTPSELTSGSERVFYAFEKFYPDYEIVVNLQGDEPFISTSFVQRLIEVSRLSGEGIVSGYSTVGPGEASSDSAVKVVLCDNSYALYFSRAMIPHGARVYKKHMGVYVWRTGMLRDFSRRKKSYLEKTEKLEQLRVLQSGGNIKMLECENDSLGIDTPEDLKKARAICASGSKI
ncbi:MAG: 3-deoxy-manno-octulosonate cytidylyltransferase, partial [Elusimicrobiota bacterium]